MTSPQAEDVVAACSVEALPLERFTLKSPDLKGVVLGFAAFHEITTRKDWCSWLRHSGVKNVGAIK
jgi:GntR family transcriptional regulator/MocR family aminotransferase